MGKGAARTWSCVCGGEPVPDGDVDLESADMCPVCTVWEQVTEVEQATGVSRESPEAKRVPLFPTHDGRMPDKRNVVAAWAELFGEAALDWNPAEQDGQLGAPEYVGVDGHSPRRSGAKFLIRVGWFREGVAYLGRWGSVGRHPLLHRGGHPRKRNLRPGRPGEGRGGCRRRTPGRAPHRGVRG